MVAGDCAGDSPMVLRNLTTFPRNYPTYTAFNTSDPLNSPPKGVNVKELICLSLLMGGGCGVVKVVGMSYAVYQNCVETRRDIEMVTKQSGELRREREQKARK